MAANASLETGLEAGQSGFQMYFQAFVQPPNAGLTSRGNGPCMLWWGESTHSALRRVWHRRFLRESSWLGDALEDVDDDCRRPTDEKKAIWVSLECACSIM